MTNLIQFPIPTSAAAATAGNSDLGVAFLEAPAEHSHAVQFYDSEDFLFETVARFLGAGLRSGDRMVVIATPEHRDGFVERLGEDAVARAVADGRLLMLDARQTLARFMVTGMPDPDLFRDTIGRALIRLRDGQPQARIRAYGEMVDLLWSDGNARAAIRLEELWNDIGQEHDFALLCAYVMGNFYKEGETARFMEVCRNHSHVIPTERFTRIDDAHARLREISLLQQRAHALESEIAHRKELEAALRDALRERGHVEEELRACVRREQVAREQAEASDAYKEMFVGILGHDLRNPLNTILTTAQLMRLRGDASAEGDKRLDRIAASGARMERMIGQLLDVTRARLADGIPVDRSQEHDLVAITRRIVDESRAANPAQVIELRAQGACRVHVDPDRFEQVVSNLVGNAVVHGDSQRPITVAVDHRGGVASVMVRNFGSPIDEASIPTLFDPFKRHESGHEGPTGLGLGLYIAERIVTAHGGTIDVTSTAAGGTCFDVTIPA
jgi:signal transduction histidine kinase